MTRFWLCVRIGVNLEELWGVLRFLLMELAAVWPISSGVQWWELGSGYGRALLWHNIGTSLEWDNAWERQCFVALGKTLCLGSLYCWWRERGPLRAWAGIANTLFSLVSTHVYLLFHLCDFFPHNMDNSGLNAEWELLGWEASRLWWKARLHGETPN